MKNFYKTLLNNNEYFEGDYSDIREFAKHIAEWKFDNCDSGELIKEVTVELLSKEYGVVDNYFDKECKQQFENYLNDLIAEYNEIIESQNWYGSMQEQAGKDYYNNQL